MPSSTPPTSRTATGRHWCWPKSSNLSRGYGTSSPVVAIYAGDKLKDAPRRSGKWTIDIVKRSDTAQGFEVLPRRWVVERTLAWLNRNKRLAKDFEQTTASAAAWLVIASVQPVLRRIARH